MSDAKVLIIDDEPDICELLSLTLHRMALPCDIAGSYQDAIRKIDTGSYFLVLTDMRLPDGDGGDIVRYLQKNKPQLPVAVLTAYGSVENAVHMLKAGAFDYVSKPIDLTLLKSLIQVALTLYQRPVTQDERLVGNSDVMQQLRQQISKLARSQAPVFIQGESGVGKELVARLIHYHGPRAEKPFIAVNCAAIPNELMESEFFGHKKGSFTGAFSDQQGLFVAAEGGTLFLDEVAELPLSMQVKLLRAIQEKAIKPIGGLVEMPVDVRVLSATNKNLQEEVAHGRFRQELYYRINVIELRVPTLKERVADIPLLAEHILAKLAHQQKINPIHLSAECLELLQTYSFPGNVRELENILERALALCNGEKITREDLQLPEWTQKKEPMLSTTQFGLEQSLIEHERALILNALEQTRWNRTAAAKLLGLSFRVLRYRLRKLGID